jgi:hypothetical protein
MKKPTTPADNQPAPTGVALQRLVRRPVEPTRSIANLSLLWPLAYGDILELDGPEGGNIWRVDRSSAGWYLHALDGATVATRHPKIHSIDGMADFIYAILEWSKAYSN